MKTNLLHRVFFTVAVICIITNADAKVWRVNNTVGINANFTQISDAVASASVLAGDTLYIEGSATTYNTVELKKRLVIIGPGYLLTGTGSNPGLQYNIQPATINTFYLDSLGSGSVIMGLSGYFYLSGSIDNLTLTRNNLALYTYNLQNTGQVNSNIRISKNYLTLSVGFTIENAEITNNIMSGPCTLNSTNNRNILFRNNVLTYGAPNISGAYVSNNIFTVTTATFTNSTVRYNIATGNNVLPSGNNNQNNIALNTIFVASGSYDGYYRLLPNSPAISAGEPINGVTPDSGAFGTADPYRLSGIPAIPSIYELSVPASVPATASSMTVTISTRSNN